MNNQTWWDAVCNASQSSYHPISDPMVLNNEQYRFYQSLRDDGVWGHTATMFSMTTEEQQLYICFMAAFHNQL